MKDLIKKEQENWLNQIRKDYEGLLSPEIIEDICVRFGRSLEAHDKRILEAVGERVDKLILPIEHKQDCKSCEFRVEYNEGLLKLKSSLQVGE